MIILDASLFFLSALALLGSPGPGIAALVAVGRRRGFRGGLPFYGGLQAGLATAAAVSAFGLFSLLRALPFTTTAMTAATALYLIYLAWRIASAPVGGAPDGMVDGFAATAQGGFLLGITNPKAYLAFASLMATYSLIHTSEAADISLKWTICVLVAIIVDIIWLWLGAAVGKLELSSKTERLLNIAMGGTILLTALLSFT